MLDNIMLGVTWVLLVLAVLTWSPDLMLIGCVLAVFGVCGFYEEG